MLQSMDKDRRTFIKDISLTAGMINLPGLAKQIADSLPAIGKNDQLRVSILKKPLAIAMWDYSWILRHHRYGEFENWDMVLEGLAERGYNAIRIDAMPQYVAADTSGKLDMEFRSVKNGWGPVFWFDHPEPDWNWVKTSGEICIDLAKKHENYKFLCTSNFTHPQFRGM